MCVCACVCACVCVCVCVCMCVCVCIFVSKHQHFLKIRVFYSSYYALTLVPANHGYRTSQLLTSSQPPANLDASSSPSCHCSCQRMATLMSSSDTMMACCTRALLCSRMRWRIISAASFLIGLWLLEATVSG